MQRLIRAKRIVGLDININEIRCIQMRQTKRQFIIEQAETQRLPEGAIVDGKIQVFDQVIECIRMIIQRMKIQNNFAAIALPVQSVISKRTQQFKKMSHESRMREMTENLLHYFPGVTQELCYDYVVLSPVDALHDNVLVIATRYEQLNDYVNVVERAGLSVKIVDVDIYALARAVKFAIATEAGSPLVAVLNVHANVARFLVLHHDEIIYHLQFDYREITDIYAHLSSGIQICCSMHHLSQLNQLYLAGDTRIITLLVNEVPDKWNMTAQIVSPLQQMTLSPAMSSEKIAENAEKLWICCGLAMRRIPGW